MAETFNDGVVRFYDVPPPEGLGGLPEPGALTLKETLRYRERTVGINRRNLFLQENVLVARVIRCIRRTNISTQDVAVTEDGARYAIRQIQYPDRVLPKVMDVTLEALVQKYAGD